MIGVFDSGFGGLTVLNAITSRLPQHSYLYLADNAQAPYGDRSAEEIFSFTAEGVRYLFDEGCTLIILACNTASSSALRRIQQEVVPDYPGRRVLGIVVSTIEQLTNVPWNDTKPQPAEKVKNTIGVLATTGTVRSHAYEHEIQKRRPSLRIVTQACPPLVPLIENGAPAADVKRALQNCFKELNAKVPLEELNGLLLGCTHYELIKDDVRQLLPGHVELYRQPEIVAQSLAGYLSKHPEIASKLDQTSTRRFLTTGDPGTVSRLARRFWPDHIQFEQIYLKKLGSSRPFTPLQRGEGRVYSVRVRGNIRFSVESFFYQRLVRPLMFRIDPERIHNFMIRIGRLLGSNPLTRWLIKTCFSYQNPLLTQTIAGITFANPVGLSAGFDKEGDLINILPVVGFGAAEIGSVTAEPYAGNPPPRLRRLPKSKGIVVNFGLKSRGVASFIRRFSSHSSAAIPLGISIAKTNCVATANEEKGIADYARCFRELLQAQAGDWYTINISCPNSFGGEPFTAPEPLEKLLQALPLDEAGDKPVFLKMPVDLPWDEFRPLLDIAVRHKITGVIIGNLTKKRAGLPDQLPATQPGGISGRPTFALSNDLISRTYRAYGQRLIIIGVGGIFSAADAYEKIKRGASLVQLITGMIYQGPQLIGQINSELVTLLQRDGYHSISEAIGKYHKNQLH